MASAWYGGWRLGLLATVISDGLGAYFVLRPFERTETDYIADSIEIALFSASGFGISCIAEQLRSARRRAEANERAAKEALSQVKALSGLLPISAYQALAPVQIARWGSGATPQWRYKVSS